MAATAVTVGETMELATWPAPGWAQGHSGGWERSDWFCRCQVDPPGKSWRRSDRKGTGREVKRYGEGRAMEKLVVERKWEAGPWLLALARPMGSQASVNLSAVLGNR